MQKHNMFMNEQWVTEIKQEIKTSGNDDHNTTYENAWDTQECKGAVNSK